MGLPPFAAVDVIEALAQGMIEQNGLQIVHEGRQAYYAPLRHAVVMPRPEMFKSPLAYYSTLLHELGHSTSKLLGRELDTNFGSESYAREEAAVDMAANLCLARLHTQPSAEQIASCAQTSSPSSKPPRRPASSLSAFSRSCPKPCSRKSSKPKSRAQTSRTCKKS
jgi:antirestriction protein ArdC